MKAACDGDEGVTKNTEYQYCKLNHNGVFCAAHAAWCGLKGFEVMPGNLRLQVTETRVEDLIRKTF